MKKARKNVVLTDFYTGNLGKFMVKSRFFIHFLGSRKEFSGEGRRSSKVMMVVDDGIVTIVGCPYQKYCDTPDMTEDIP